MSARQDYTDSPQDNHSRRMKISVIIPVYQVEKTLQRCVDSIIAQSFADWEAILVDDGSTDGSAAICDSYHATDCRIKTIHQDNRHRGIPYSDRETRHQKIIVNKGRFIAVPLMRYETQTTHYHAVS